jgi:hypothetical protein
MALKVDQALIVFELALLLTLPFARCLFLATVQVIHLLVDRLVIKLLSYLLSEISSPQALKKRPQDALFSSRLFAFFTAL